MRLIGLLPILLASGLMAVVIIWLLNRPDIHPDYLFQDAIDFNQTGRPYLGFFSNLSVILWLSGANWCAFATLIRWRLAAPNQRFTLYLGALASVGLWLGLDDLYLFHESLAVRYLGLKEEMFLIFYAIGVILFLVFFFHQLIQHERLYLCLSLGLLGFSQLIDLLNGQQRLLAGERHLILLEDVTQFLGVVAFWTYCARISLIAGLAAFQTKASPFSFPPTQFRQGQ